MDTIIPQAGNNVASQFTKASELPVTDRIQKADSADAAKSANSNAKPEQEPLKASAENTQAISRQADTVKQEEGVASIEQVDEALGNINQYLQSTSTQLSFSVDEATDRSIVTVTDAATGDVIRQIPSEEVLKFAERLNELQSEFGSNTGNLLKGQA
jgi:flagellar protein FlaG